jgi:hypothetical protein
VLRSCAAASPASRCQPARNRPDWWLLATIVYAAVAGLLLLRLAVGLCLTWRLARAAKPMSGPQMVDADVRVSRDVGGLVG